MLRGQFISFEGIDGAGKSTHVPWCFAELELNGINVVQVREPGGTPLGESLRELLLTKPMSALSETLLMFASRHQLLTDIIEPTLARGDWVISDRFVDASFAYQGGGRGVSADTLNWLCKTSVGNLMPDCTFWLDAPLEVAHSRRLSGRKAINGTDDRFEQENKDFFQQVHEAYAIRWQENPSRIIRIDSTLSIDDIRVIMAEKLNAMIRIQTT